MLENRRTHRMLSSTWTSPCIPVKHGKSGFKNQYYYDPNFKPRSKSITYTREVTQARFSVEPEYLVSIEKQNVLKWKKNCLVAMKRCKRVKRLRNRLFTCISGPSVT